MVRLTEFAHAAGCGCKIAPAVLKSILSQVETGNDFPLLLVGNSSNDDAAVWDLGNGLAIINTVDFFMPIVDNAFDFGRIAAANALSDVYAMGGKPIMANAILGWPVEILPVDLAAEVLNGAKSVCELAGIPLAGGHSVDAKEPFFGLSVNGFIPSDKVKKNNTAKLGDVLFLTKPIGTGIAATSIKRKIEAETAVADAVKWMCTLNTLGSLCSELDYVHAMTDVTGFGLCGHIIEMAEGSGLQAKLNFGKIKVLDGIDDLLSKNCIPDNTYRNWNAYEKKVSGISDMRSFQLLNDPQTSGGLLIAIDSNYTGDFIEVLKQHGLEGFSEPIGELIEPGEFSLQVHS